MEYARMENISNKLINIQKQHFPNTETKPQKRHMGKTKQEQYEKKLIRSKNLWGVKSSPKQRKSKIGRRNNIYMMSWRYGNSGTHPGKKPQNI